jgi:LysM repeat protein
MAQAQIPFKEQYLKMQYKEMGSMLPFYDTFEKQSKVKEVLYFTDEQGFTSQGTNYFTSLHDFVIPGLANAYCVAGRKDPPYYSSRSYGQWNFVLNHEKGPSRNLGIMGIQTYTREAGAKLTFSYTTPLPVGDYDLKILTENRNKSLDITIIINGGTSIAVSPASYSTDMITVSLPKTTIRSLEIRTVKNKSNQEEFVLHGLYFKPTNQGAIIVHQLPILGGLFQGLLKQSYFLAQVKEIDPSLILLEPGIDHLLHGYNKYNSNSDIGRVFKGIQTRLGSTTIIGISPQETFRFLYPITETKQFNIDFKSLCMEYNFGFIDWYASSGAGASAEWEKGHYLQANKKYLNEKGMELKEQQIAAVFYEGFQQIVQAKNISQVLPDYGVNPAATGQNQNPDEDLASDKPKRILHQVGQGQNLYRISLAYDVSTQDLIKWNNLPNDQVQNGQIIIIYRDNKRKDLPPIPKIDQDHNANKRKFHKVMAGQTLFSIARDNNTTVDNIKSLNNLKTNEIAVGQLLRIQ